MWTFKGELGSNNVLIYFLDNIDTRVHAEMYPNNPKNVYKACLAGTRR